MEPRSELLPLAQGMKATRFRSGRKFELRVKTEVECFDITVTKAISTFLSKLFCCTELARYAGNPADVVSHKRVQNGFAVK